MENDDLNEIPPHDNLINDKRFNYCINEQTYQVINEKKILLQDLKRQRDELLDGFSDKNCSVFTKNELITNIMLKRLNLEMFKNELNSTDAALKQNREELSLLKKRVAKKKQLLATYVQKIEKCKEMLERSEQEAYKKTNNEKEGFNMQRVRLIEYEKQRIEELNRFIFSLVEIKPKDEDILQKSTRTALKDARQTVYVNGRWILANDHVIYKIVRSTLPTDGDYMPYFRELQTSGGQKSGASGVGGADDEKLMPNDDHLHYIASVSNSGSGLSTRAHQSTPLVIQTGGVGGLPLSPASATTSAAASAALYSSSLTSGGGISPLISTAVGANSGIAPSSATAPLRCIDRRSILSGLTFTVQFVNLIAFYLNIVLPYNIPHNKFATQSLTDDQFQNAVAKLNTNIVYLSINQHIPVTNLLPKHTLENLHHFLTYFREMRIKIRERHSISFPNHIVPLLEEMFTDVDKDDLDADVYGGMPQDAAAANLIFGDGSNEEWETVPSSSEIPSDDTYMTRASAARQSVTRTVSSSLISSVISQFWFSRGGGAAATAGSGSSVTSNTNNTNQANK